MPIILLFCVLGAYAINGSTFDVGVMLGMGLSASCWSAGACRWARWCWGSSSAARWRSGSSRSLTGADGSPLAFVDRPLAAVLGLAWLLLWGLILFRGRRRPGPEGPPSTVSGSPGGLQSRIDQPRRGEGV